MWKLFHWRWLPMPGNASAAWLVWLPWLAMGVLPDGLGCPRLAAQSPSAAQPAGRLVPQNLLKLLHAPEVQRELKLSSEQVSELEDWFARVDGDWFRSRSLPADEQRRVVDQLEAQAWQWFRQHGQSSQSKRLRELLYRSQGVRMLLNQEVSRAIGLQASQLSELAAAAEEVLADEQAYQRAAAMGEDLEEARRKLETTVQRERELLPELLSPEQVKQVNRLRGQDFDTRSLRRIYPMAPELISTGEWLNSSPLTLATLRGRIVLVHFYAFQCHNCHANFPIYQRWHERYQDRGVVVIGIQTPETAAEAEPERVRAAAEERGFQFPVLLDLDKRNWDAWSNTMWPTVYVVDQRGYLRHWWQGELNWRGATGDQAIEQLVEQLLQEQPQP